ncbi:thermonuclease family protein [Brevundimonas sp. DC300-4]|uniref:thermonuclease family protein n=1 Tax=Brevundimonas sp. DC300-4 TaxID=2804594 RepID=UPI003CF19C8F
MLGAFGLTYWWPELTTESPITMLPTLAASDTATDTQRGEPTDSRPETSSFPSEGLRFSCQVTSVTDGDTFRCAGGERIRLHAVAARETDETCSVGHPCPAASGASATAELRRLVQGRRLQCQPIGQSYGRVTAICWDPRGVEVNCAMVRSGATVIWDRFNRQDPICRA